MSLYGKFEIEDSSGKFEKLVAYCDWGLSNPPYLSSSSCGMS